jgi:hypothetical protein
MAFNPNSFLIVILIYHFERVTLLILRPTNEQLLTGVSVWELLSLQETLCGCTPKVLGNLTNGCFCIL